MDLHPGPKYICESELQTSIHPDESLCLLRAFAKIPDEYTCLNITRLAEQQAGVSVDQWLRQERRGCEVGRLCPWLTLSFRLCV